MPNEPFPELAATLSLAGLEPFAMGGYRVCYVHPGDEGLCVKVPRRDDERCRLKQWRELEDYASLKKRGSEALFDRIPAIEGVVETDLGVGIVSSLCRDADGRISRSLGALIQEQAPAPSLLGAIDEWKRWVREQRLFTRDTGPHNVVAVGLGGDAWKLVIVDGLMNRRCRWLARRHRALTDYMIGRQLAKFDRRVANLMGPNRDVA